MRTRQCNGILPLEGEQMAKRDIEVEDDGRIIVR